MNKVHWAINEDEGDREYVYYGAKENIWYPADELKSLIFLLQRLGLKAIV